MTWKNDYLMIEKKLIQTRRNLHKNAEIGFELPKTRSIIKNYLESLDINYEENKGGIMGFLEGKNSQNTILLRADIDALPMSETTDLTFKSTTGNMHACGHDMHAIALLGTLHLLILNENLLNKNVVFLFQSNEEGGKGAKEALKNSIFTEIDIDEAFAVHVDAKAPLGMINYGYGKTFASSNNMKIILKGKSSHGARAYEGVDPLNGIVQIYSGLKNMIQNELNVFNHNIFAITAINTNDTYNIIPETATMNASLRTYDEQDRIYILERIENIVEKYSDALNLDYTIEMHSDIPEVITNKNYTDKILDRIRKEDDSICIADSNLIKMGSEDFAYISNRFPKCAYFFIGAGKSNLEGFEVGQHNSNVIFNEEAIFYEILTMIAAIKA